MEVNEYPETPPQPADPKKYRTPDPRNWMPNISPPPHIDTYLGIEDLVQQYGYKAERHEAQTEDGYILTMFRIYAQNSTNSQLGQRPPVLFQHGWTGSCANWLMNGEQSLPYLAYEQGNLDVWLGNFRGNSYSRGNINYSRSESEYWDFDISDHSLKDYPA